jgi:hypothetical protein
VYRRAKTSLAETLISTEVNEGRVTQVGQREGERSRPGGIRGPTTGVGLHGPGSAPHGADRRGPGSKYLRLGRKGMRGPISPGHHSGDLQVSSQYPQPLEAAFLWERAGRKKKEKKEKMLYQVPTFIYSSPTLIFSSPTLIFSSKR